MSDSVFSTNEDSNVIKLFPMDYLSCKDGFWNDVNITENTYTVHHFAASSANRSYLLKRWFFRLLGRKKVEYLIEIKRVMFNLFSK